MPALAGLTALMLNLAFAPYNIWPLGFAALVPWVAMMELARTNRRAAIWGFSAGVLFWAGGLYWLWWITLGGYIALVLYMAVYWLAAAIVVKASLERRWSMTLVLPVLWVAMDLARSYAVSGFPWFQLAHTQYSKALLIQIADFAGESGVSFFVAMVNGAVADVLLAMMRRRSEQSQPGAGVPNGLLARRVWVGPAAAIIVTMSVVGYGLFRLNQQTQSLGPAVGIVQQAHRIALDRPSVSDKQNMREHLELTALLAGRGCDMVIWPETMLPHFLNPEFLAIDGDKLSQAQREELLGPGMTELRLEYSDSKLISMWQENMLAYGKAMVAASKAVDCPILAGGATLHYNADPVMPGDSWLTRNSVLLFDKDMPRPGDLYSKVQLVPFSEYVPLKKQALGLHKAIRSVVPPEMQQLDPGTEFTVFKVGPRPWRVATPICYEGVFARVNRRMVVQDGQKVVDLLANLSNDGWFVWPWGVERGSNEHYQHLAHYAFRAVENRVPVVRAVNTGISASIDSNGRIVSRLSRMVGGQRQDTMVAGAMLLGGIQQDPRQLVTGPQVLVDSRVSVYSQIGDVFGAAVSAAAIALVGYLAYRRFGQKRKGSTGE